jgi:hypothetical protein
MAGKFLEDAPLGVLWQCLILSDLSKMHEAKNICFSIIFFWGDAQGDGKKQIFQDVRCGRVKIPASSAPAAPGACQNGFFAL